MTDVVHPTVLDTDIGSDVDDLLALTLLARAPEVRLIGITTVYGDTRLRARIARWTCDRLDRPDVTVIPGLGETLSGREIWWPGHEGVGLADLERVPVAEATGVDYLCQTAREHAGELDLIAIGPLTNVAAALRQDPAFASNLHHLYIMGGAFWLDRAEHNFKCDPEAADLVMRSGIPMSLAGLDVTKRVWVTEADLAALEGSGHALGAVLADQVRRWWAASGREQDNPHDALAALMPFRPDLFRFQRCNVTVETDGAQPGRSVIAGCGQGQVALAAEVDVAQAQREILHRLLHHV
ncbi:MAG: nucleoside hydrolase [Chloroflexota bacterium]|nr:nucleoside hydrolase [Chloroflexota bacterium]